MLHTARIVLTNTPYHVTQRGNRRENVFFSDADRLAYLRFMKQYALQHGLHRPVESLLGWTLRTKKPGRPKKAVKYGCRRQIAPDSLLPQKSQVPPSVVIDEKYILPVILPLREAMRRYAKRCAATRSDAPLRDMMPRPSHRPRLLPFTKVFIRIYSDHAEPDLDYGPL